MLMIRKRAVCSSEHLLSGLAAISLVGALLVPMRAAAQERSLLIAASFAGKESMRSNEQIEFVLNRCLEESEGKIAVFIGTTDVSTLFTREELRLRYNPKLWP